MKNVTERIEEYLIESANHYLYEGKSDFEIFKKIFDNKFENNIFNSINNSLKNTKYVIDKKHTFMVNKNRTHSINFQLFLKDEFEKEKKYLLSMVNFPMDIHIILNKDGIEDNKIKTIVKIDKIKENIIFDIDNVGDYIDNIIKIFNKALKMKK